MTKLTNNQKKNLRAMGHILKPVIMIGRQGLSAAVLAELELSLTKHELLKIKISADNSEQKQQIIEKIIEFSQAHLVQVIGNVLVIYRAFDEPKIILGRR